MFKSKAFITAFIIAAIAVFVVATTLSVFNHDSDTRYGLNQTPAATQEQAATESVTASSDTAETEQTESAADEETVNEAL